MPRKSAEKEREEAAADPKQLKLFAAVQLTPRPVTGSDVRPSPEPSTSQAPAPEVTRPDVEQIDQTTQCDLREGDVEPMRVELLGMIMDRIFRMLDEVIARSRQKESKMSKKKRLRVTQDLL